MPHAIPQTHSSFYPHRLVSQCQHHLVTILLKEIDKHPNIIADRLAVLKVFLQWPVMVCYFSLYYFLFYPFSVFKHKRRMCS